MSQHHSVGQTNTKGAKLKLPACLVNLLFTSW